MTGVDYKQRAEAEITSYDNIIVNFQVKNTGNVFIQEWKVIIEISTNDGIFIEKKYGENLGNNQTQIESILIKITGDINKIEIKDLIYW